METALRRNLDHAALRVNIQAGVREQMMLAFRRLRLPARNRTLRQRVASRAEAFVRHQALTRGFDRLNALLEWWRRIYARARRHSRLTDMMRVIERMRRELEGARRAERAARRRAERQQRTFLRMYARLLLSRWRDSNVQFFVALRTSRFEVLRTRLQARGAVGAWCVACTECKARAAMRVSALALAAWHRAARGVVVWSVHASERRAAHREVLVQGRRAESHRQSMQLARVRRALGAWRRSNSRRVRAHALASRALRRWVRAAARSRDALRRQRLLAGHKPFADDHRRRFSQWRRAARRVARSHALQCAALLYRWRREVSRGLSTWQGEAWRLQASRHSRSLESRRSRRAVLRRWLQRCRQVTAYIASIRTATLELVRLLGVVRRRAGLGLWLEHVEWVAAGLQLRHSAEAWAVRKQFLVWRHAQERLSALRAASRSLMRTAIARHRQQRLDEHMAHWVGIAAPLASLDRLAEQLGFSLRWRRAASSLAHWQMEHASRARRQRATVELAALRLGGVPVAWGRWTRVTAALRRHRALRAALRAVLGREPWGLWLKRTGELAAENAAVAAAAAACGDIRREATWLEWREKFRAEHAVASRLWALRLDLTTERRLRHEAARFETWRLRARGRARWALWMRLAEGHELITRQARGLRRWKLRVRRRLEAADAESVVIAPLAASASATIAEALRRAHASSVSPPRYHPPPPRPPPPPRAPLAPLPAPSSSFGGLDQLLDQMVVMQQFKDRQPPPSPRSQPPASRPVPQSQARPSIGSWGSRLSAGSGA
jgi:hypothetical protein